MQRIRFSRLSHISALLLLSFTFTTCLSDMPVDPQPGPDEKVKTLEEIIDPDGDGIGISPGYVDIHWDEGEAKVTKGDLKTGEFTIDFGKNKIPEIKEGSTMALDVDSTILLRKVKEIRQEDNTVVVETVQGCMEDVFINTSFTLCSYDESEETSAPLTRADGTPIPSFYPVAYIVKNEHGGFDRLPASEYIVTRGEDEAIKEWSDKFPTERTLYEKGPFYIKTNSELLLSFGVKLTMNFKVNNESSSWGEIFDMWEAWNNEMVNIRCTINPKFQWTGYVTMGASYKIADEKTLFKKQLAKTNIVKVVFAVGIVPVVIDGNVELNAATEFDSELSAEIKTGFTFGGGVEIGFQYSQVEGFDGICKSDFTYNFIPPTASVALHNKLRFGLYPTIAIRLYDVLGPEFSVGPYIASEFGAGVVTDLCSLLDPDKASTALGWQANAYFGARFCIKADMTIFKKNIFSKTLTETELGPQHLLFEAPTSIKLYSDPDRVTVGEWNEVQFRLKAKLPNMLSLGSTVTGPLAVPAMIRYETSGDGIVSVDKTGSKQAVVGWSNSIGASSVYWKPAKANETLTAVIYSDKGEMIDKAEATASAAPSSVAAMDMGTSVLWASHNYGATEAQEYGAYVGWGDVTGKHTEQCFSNESTYGKSSYVADEKKCYGYYGGFDYDRDISGGSKDIVHANWKGQWRIPTIDEWQELINSCSVKWQDGGVLLTSKIVDGQQLFLPAAGSRWGSSHYEKTGQSLDYWSSTPIPNDPDITDRFARYVCFEKGDKAFTLSGMTYRFVGQSIRPVRDK